MALTALKGKKLKRKTVRARARKGVLGAPVDGGFDAVKDYFHYEIDRKDIISQTKSFIKKNFNKTQAKYILANPDYKFSFSHYAATAFWYNTEQEVTERSEYWKQSLMKRLSDLIESGKTLHHEKVLEAKETPTVVSLSPQQRLQNKISNTIMQDLLNLEDAWMDGEKASINVYELFRKHGLSGSATLPVRQVVEGWLLDYEDAYHKRCEQAVEGYSHLKRPELNRRIKECQAMLEDLDRIKAAKKATRKTNKTPSLEKQVSKVKYKKEDNDYKIVSINPAQIVGKSHLLCFNTKTRKLIEYKTESTDGFIISGTTIKNINSESRAWTLRKPMDILPSALSSTPKQFEKLVKEITTKPSTPNGRINEDTVLLRVLK
jgi:hypothetical protein